MPVAVVHSPRAGQARQAPVGNRTMIASPPWWRQGLQYWLAVPWGQVTWRASQLMANMVVV